jgi:hypothetical protein
MDHVPLPGTGPRPVETSPVETSTVETSTVEPFTIEQSARMAGAWVWAELSLYEVVGTWVVSTAAAPAKVYFAACSQHHAWRAELWSERLPARLVTGSPPEVPRAPEVPGGGAALGDDRAGDDRGDDVVRPFSRGAEAALEALSGLEDDVGRLAAYCRVVLARSAVGYRRWQARCSPSSDRPIARVLAMALADVLGDWQDGSGVLVDLLEGRGGHDAAAAAAANASSTIERLLLGEGLAPGA